MKMYIVRRLLGQVTGGYNSVDVTEVGKPNGAKCILVAKPKYRMQPGDRVAVNGNGEVVQVYPVNNNGPTTYPKAV